MIYILIPLYNDWEALALLLRRFDETVEPSLRQRMRFAVINDCSSVEPAPGQFSAWPLEVIHLNRNVGHQKAIALGLAFLTKEREFEAVIVMDSDGEDRPEDTATLYANGSRIKSCLPTAPSGTKAFRSGRGTCFTKPSSAF